MADQIAYLIGDALERIVAEPAGLPLFASKAAPGLFPNQVAGKQAARRCKDEGLLTVLRTQARGKTAQEICTLSEKGLAYLLERGNPRSILESLAQSFEAKQAQYDCLIALVRDSQTHLKQMRDLLAKFLLQQHAPAPAAAPSERNGQHADPEPIVLAALQKWRLSGALDDLPLPDLFAALRLSSPAITIGLFHDTLRRLQEQQKLYLHPWTGPLYQLPTPTLALLVGHEIAYYASLKLSDV